jgi:mannose-6-phosphate isomerase
MPEPADLSGDALRSRLCDSLRVWAERGLDRERGGYWNRLTHALEPVREPHKRLLVHARLIYAFSEGVRQGAGDWARAAAEHGYAFLRERFRDRHRGGYFLTTTREGGPADTRKELYAHAFVVFALAHHARAQGSREALEEARGVLALLRDRLAAPAGGLLECADAGWSPLPGPRLQNPHMHLLEALLALDEVEPDADSRALADQLFALCADRFVDRVQGYLGESFDSDWRPSAGGDGMRVEPGHHFEWVWLLHAYALGRDCREALALADLLHGFARRRGVDADQLVFDSLAPSGRVTRDSKRLWPQTEHLKALAARGEIDALRGALRRVQAAYLDPSTHGWREQLDRGGRVTSDALNATSVYHVVLALREAAAALEPRGVLSP